MASYPVRTVAKAMSVHPRTLWRAYTNERNPKWSESDDYDPPVDLSVIAERFSTTPEIIQFALDGKDTLHSQIDTAERLGVKIRTFKNRNYPVALRRGRIVRYSWHDVIDYQFKHHPKDALDSLR